MPRWFTSLLTLTAFLLTIVVPVGAARAQVSPQPAPPATAAPAPAEASPPPPELGPPAASGERAIADAQAYFEQGKTAFQAGDYVTAIRNFKTAQALKYSPKLDYNIALSYEQLGRPRAAAKYYRAYLASLPGAPNRAEVEQKLAELDARAAQMKEAQEGAQAVPPPQAGQAAPYPQAGQAAPYPYGGPVYAPAPYPPPAYAPAPPPPAHGSHWWIVFPIVGAVLVVTAIVVVVAVVASPSSSYYYERQPTQTSTINPGVTLFRF